MAGYKMPKVSKSGPAGLAKVQLGARTGKVKITVTYKDREGNENVEEIVLDKKDCPAWIKSGLFRVKFSGDKKKLFSAVPANEQVVCQFKDISHEEGQLPVPKEKSGGKYDPYLEFILIMEVVEGPFKGMEIPVWMRYNFIKLTDGGKTVAALPEYKTARHLKMLEDVLYALGILEYGALKWSDNLLPAIQKRAQRAVEEFGTKALVTIGPEGYVMAVSPVVTDLDEDDDAFGDLESDDDEGDGAGDHDANAPVSEPDPDDEIPFGKDELEDDGGTGVEPVKKAADDDDIDWGDETE